MATGLLESPKLELALEDDCWQLILLLYYSEISKSSQGSPAHGHGADTTRGWRGTRPLSPHTSAKFPSPASSRVTGYCSSSVSLQRH